MKLLKEDSANFQDAVDGFLAKWAAVEEAVLQHKLHRELIALYVPLVKAAASTIKELKHLQGQADRRLKALGFLKGLSRANLGNLSAFDKFAKTGRVSKH